MEVVILNGQPLTLAEIEAVSLANRRVEIAPAARARMAASRATIEQILAAGQTVYGVNTGFGKLSDVRIPPEKLAQLQTNLVRSHAAGWASRCREAEARAMLLLRANVLAKGFSGNRPELVELLVAMLNAGVHPVIPGKGLGGRERRSGAAGAPRAGGHRRGRGVLSRRTAARRARRCSAPGLRRWRWRPRKGLALLNGTQAMTAVGALAVARARRVVQLADVAGAMSLEALMGTPAAFDPRIHQARPHAGQIAAAAHLVALLAGSEIRESHREH